jgi:citrate lyase subunit beta / citryl-CoA lyase
VTELPLPGGTSSRSYLYVPADREDRLSRAAARGADALILDLEDSVPAAGKDQARQLLAGWLARQRDTDCELWVRINPPTAAEDITAIAGTLVTGVAVPKAETALLAEVCGLLAGAESAMGVAPGRFGVLPIVETARGLQSVADVAASPRVVRLGLGEADLAADLGVQLSPHRAELLPVRLQVVVAAAAAGIGAPIGPVSTDFRDLDGLRESTRALLALGFRARSAIHPAQLPVINAVFTPSEAEIARAGQLVGVFETAKRAGAGVFTHVDGTMVDVAVVRSAREILARAGMARPGADQRY